MIEFGLLVIASIVIHGFYSMLEMSVVSFNKVRLQYYIGKGNRRAIWLSKLLERPTLLFCTTLITINTAMQFGSECSRRFYMALDLSPDWAPVTQIFLVLIFAELSPMFAARRYPERVSMLGAPFLYFVSIILRPLIWLVGGLCTAIGYLFGARAQSALAISRDELQKAIESREEVNDEELETISSNIFSLKSKTVRDLMTPLMDVTMLSVAATIKDLREAIGDKPFVPLYHSMMENIVAVAYPRDLLRLPPETRVRPHSRAPWFITESSSILTILSQFRNNNQSIAIVLSETGAAIGILTLDDIVDEIFGERDEWVSFGEYLPEKHHIVIERSFPAETAIREIHLPIHLPQDQGETLLDIMEKHLGHEPDVGETVDLAQIELTYLDGKKILIRTR